ncbi:hypothetical protein C1M53_09175 [Mesorhizobium sp. Pch-S]|nr:hypothetical protein C1M53_09175 [Mesorhizobium sp. Pch-S]
MIISACSKILACAKHEILFLRQSTQKLALFFRAIAGGVETESFRLFVLSHDFQCESCSFRIMLRG